MTVYLVGAGPGDGDLLTVRAANLLQRALVVVRDRLIDPSVLEYINPEAVIYDVGKRAGESSTQSGINDLLIQLAMTHDTVVRLKGGDPFVFGRGGEEMLALRAAGVGCEVVPGLSSALAGPLAAGIPVTHRGVSRGVAIVSARGEGGDLTDFRRLSSTGLTLVILMGIENRRVIAKQLVEGGLEPTTPVAVVEGAWTNQQRTTRAELSALGSLDVASPAVIVVGDVASFDLRSLNVRDVVAR